MQTLLATFVSAWSALNCLISHLTTGWGNNHNFCYSLCTSLDLHYFVITILNQYYRYSTHLSHQGVGRSSGWEGEGTSWSHNEEAILHTCYYLKEQPTAAKCIISLNGKELRAMKANKKPHKYRNPLEVSWIELLPEVLTEPWDSLPRSQQHT